MKYLLGIDIGTTNVKAVLFNTKGNSVGCVNRPYPTSHPFPGWSEQNPEDWYATSISAIRELLTQTAINPSNIISAGFAGHIRSIAFLDKYFGTVYPGIVWSDTRSSKTVDRLNDEMEDFLVEVTGNQAATNFSLSQILWMKENHPEVIEKTRYYVTPKDYVIYRLTGKLASDSSTQSGSLLLDIDRKDWSNRLLIRLGISRECLPVILRSIDVVGRITKTAAENSGLMSGMPVVVGGGDNDCAAIGSGAYISGTTSISLGTAGIILTLIDRPIRSAAGKLDVFSHVIPEAWYAMGMVKSAGFAFEWLKNRLIDERYALLGSEKRMSMDDWLENGADFSRNFVPGSNGLFCFPYYQGRGNPDKNPDATGVFWGLTESHINKQLIQSTMEGVGYCIRQCVDTISEIAPLNEIVCCGKGSSNTLWINIIANILGKPVWTSGGIGEGALGAAILAATGAGLYGTVQLACENMTKRDKQFLPQDEIVLAYEDYFARFCSLSDILWRRE
jgi:xylulokinase